MTAVANKSLVLLCLLLAIATSQADAACIDVCIKNFAVSPSATSRDVVAGCTAKCALVENQRKTIDALLEPKTEDYKRTEAALVEEEEKLTEELISLNDQLKKVNCPSATARMCYDRCRMTPRACAKRCGCTLKGTEAAVVDEEEEKLTGELIKPKSDCPTAAARNCYNVCRFTGSSQQRCAKLCGCKLIGTEAAAAVEKHELAAKI